MHLHVGLFGKKDMVLWVHLYLVGAFLYLVRVSSGYDCLVGNNCISSGYVHLISCGYMDYLVGISCG